MFRRDDTYWGAETSWREVWRLAASSRAPRPAARYASRRPARAHHRAARGLEQPETFERFWPTARLRSYASTRPTGRTPSTLLPGHPFGPICPTSCPMSGSTLIDPGDVELPENFGDSSSASPDPEQLRRTGRRPSRTSSGRNSSRSISYTAMIDYEIGASWTRRELGVLTTPPSSLLRRSRGDSPARTASTTRAR